MIDRSVYSEAEVWKRAGFGPAKILGRENSSRPRTGWRKRKKVAIFCDSFMVCNMRQVLTVANITSRL